MAASPNKTYWDNRGLSRSIKIFILFLSYFTDFYYINFWRHRTELCFSDCIEHCIDFWRKVSMVSRLFILIERLIHSNLMWKLSNVFIIFLLIYFNWINCVDSTWSLELFNWIIWVDSSVSYDFIYEFIAPNKKEVFINTQTDGIRIKAATIEDALQ